MGKVKEGQKKAIFLTVGIFLDYLSSLHAGHRATRLIQLVAIFRLVVENLLKYGILLKPETLASYMRLDILIWLLGMCLVSSLLLHVSEAKMDC